LNTSVGVGIDYMMTILHQIIFRVGPGHCCYKIGPICLLAGWRKRRSWTRVSLVLL